MRRLKPLLLLALLGAVVVAIKQRLGAATAPAPAGSTDPFMTATSRVAPTPVTGSPRPAGDAKEASVRPADTELVVDTAAEADEMDAAAGGADVTDLVAEDDVTAEIPTADGSAATAESGLTLPIPPHGPFATAPDGPPDDLKRISGVGPKLEQMLNDEGITTFAQLAALTEEQVDLLQERLPQFPGRIRRDDWVAQAQRLTSQ